MYTLTKNSIFNYNIYIYILSYITYLFSGISISISISMCILLWILWEIKLVKYIHNFICSDTVQLQIYFTKQILKNLVSVKYFTDDTSIIW